jgi:hypothetical protein
MIEINRGLKGDKVSMVNLKSDIALDFFYKNKPNSTFHYVEWGGVFRGFSQTLFENRVYLINALAIGVIASIGFQLYSLFKSTLCSTSTNTSPRAHENIAQFEEAINTLEKFVLPLWKIPDDFCRENFKKAIANWLSSSKLSGKLTVEFRESKRGVAIKILNSELTDAQLTPFIRSFLRSPLNSKSLSFENCSELTGACCQPLLHSMIEDLHFISCEQLSNQEVRKITRIPTLISLNLQGSLKILDSTLEGFGDTHLLIKPNGESNHKQHEKIFQEELTRSRLVVFNHIPIDQKAQRLQAMKKEIEVLQTKFKAGAEALTFLSYSGMSFLSDHLAGFLIPYLIKECGQLVDIDLSDTPITTKTIVTLAKSPHWRTINLRGCTRLDREALVQLSNIRQLQSLNLSIPDLTSSDLKPLAKLNHLEKLQLNGSKLLDDLAIKEIEDLPLTDLDISETLIGAQGLRWIIDSFSQLNKLILKGCRRIDSESFNRIHELDKLSYLDISRCSGISKNSFETLKNLSLQSLYCQSCTALQDSQVLNALAIPTLVTADFRNCVKLTSACLENGKAKDLAYIDFSRCLAINDAGVSALCSWAKKIKYLRLGETGISSHALGTIKENLRELKRLDISSCRDIQAGAISTLKGMPNLKDLILQGSTLSSEDLDVIGKDKDFPALDHLDLSKCRGVTDSGIGVLVDRQEFKYLLLKSLPIGNESLRYISRMKSSCLEYLNLSGCKHITLSGIEYLESQKKLNTLVLDGCSGIENELFSKIALFENLQVISIKGCNKIKPETITEFQRTHPYIRVIF